MSKTVTIGEFEYEIEKRSPKNGEYYTDALMLAIPIRRTGKVDADYWLSRVILATTNPALIADGVKAIKKRGEEIITPEQINPAYKGLELKEDFCDICKTTTNFLNGYCDECGEPDMENSFIVDTPEQQKDGENRFVSAMQDKYANIDVKKVLGIFDEKLKSVKGNVAELSNLPMTCDLNKNILLSVISEINETPIHFTPPSESESVDVELLLFKIQSLNLLVRADDLMGNMKPVYGDKSKQSKEVWRKHSEFKKDLSVYVSELDLKNMSPISSTSLSEAVELLKKLQNDYHFMTCDLQAIQSFLTKHGGSTSGE